MVFNLGVCRLIPCNSYLYHPFSGMVDSMTVIRFFPYAVAVLELAAGGVYLWHREWRLAIVWFGVGLANVAFAGVR
jgi:hypothetical protein